MRAAFEITEEMDLFGEVRLGRCGVTGAEMDDFFADVMADWKEEDKGAIDAHESSLVNWSGVCWGGRKGWRWMGLGRVAQGPCQIDVGI